MHLGVHLTRDKTGARRALQTEVRTGHGSGFSSHLSIARLAHEVQSQIPSIHFHGVTTHEQGPAFFLYITANRIDR